MTMYLLKKTLQSKQRISAKRSTRLGAHSYAILQLSVPQIITKILVKYYQ